MPIDKEITIQWNKVRDLRTSILKECDWTQLLDVPFNDTQKQAWKDYRQALRDITLQSDPFDISWPNQPS